MEPKPKLTEKQRRFVEEYLIDGNAYAAALRAGYAETTAMGRAAQWVKPDSCPRGYRRVWQAIQEAREERSERTGITADMVLKELAKIGFSNIGDYVSVTSAGDPFVDLSEMTREQSAALSEITVDEYTEGRGEDARDVKRVKVKLCDKRAALVDLGKHLGLFRENQGGEDVPMPTVVNVTVVDGRKAEQ